MVKSAGWSKRGGHTITECSGLEGSELRNYIEFFFSFCVIVNYLVLLTNWTKSRPCIWAHMWRIFSGKRFLSSECLNILHLYHTKSEKGTFLLELKCSESNSHWNDYSGKNSAEYCFGRFITMDKFLVSSGFSCLKLLLNSHTFAAFPQRRVEVCIYTQVKLKEL